MSYFRAVRAVIAILGITFSSLASAVVIDNGAYTTDTNLGLDYLDVGIVHDNYAAFAGGYLYSGKTWTLATAEQMASTWSDATGLSLTPANIFHGDNDMGEAASTILHDLFDGVTTDGGLANEAVVGDYSISGYANFMFGGTIAVHHGSWYDSHYYGPDTAGSRAHGAWLVSRSSTVPEPASIALLGLGLAGFGFSRTKKAA